VVIFYDKNQFEVWYTVLVVILNICTYSLSLILKDLDLKMCLVTGPIKIKLNKLCDVIMDLHYADSFSQTAHDADFILINLI
jgi:hypothetical protein